MAIQGTVVGCPQFVNVTTAADLINAIGAALPGTVITLTQVVTPFTLTIDKPKAAPGICIKLPAGQINELRFSNKNLNTEVLIGEASIDKVRGDILGNYSVDLGNASFFAVRGGKLGQGKNLVTSNLGATDFEITDVLLEFARADICQLTYCKRFLFDNWYGRDTNIKGRQMLFFRDGSPPIDGVADTPGNVNSFRFDAPHSDLVQAHNKDTEATVTEDFAFTRINVNMLGAGINPFGNRSSAGEVWIRGLIADCDLNTNDTAAILAEGQDIMVRDNRVGPHPERYVDAQGSVSITLVRNQSGSRVAGGRNVVTGGAVVNNPSGVILDGPVITGDAVVPPALPNLRRLPWAPSYARAAYTAYTSPPVIEVSPLLGYMPAGGTTRSGWYVGQPGAVAPPVGTFLYIGLGGVKGIDTTTVFQFRVKRDGVIVQAAGTSRVYQLQAADMGGKTIVAEVNVGNQYGNNNLWVPTAALVTA